MFLLDLYPKTPQVSSFAVSFSSLYRVLPLHSLLPLLLGPLLSGPIAFVVWLPLLLSLVMPLFLPSLQLRLGVPLRSLLHFISGMYSFLWIRVFCWVRLLLRVLYCNGLRWLGFIWCRFSVLSGGSECLWWGGGGGGSLASCRLSLSTAPSVGHWAWLSSESILSPLVRCVYGDSFVSALSPI